MDFNELKKFGKGLYYRLKGDCVFCKIVDKHNAEIVYENENVLAFAPLNSGVVAEGHLVVIPKEHSENLYEIEKESLFQIMETEKKWLTNLKKSMKA
jgi:diadenosine tetraphosphate (Ap4A) HIT family hydrolase